LSSPAMTTIRKARFTNRAGLQDSLKHEEIPFDLKNAQKWVTTWEEASK